MALEQTNSQNTSRLTATEAHTYPVDVEHVGIRVAIPVIIIVGGVLLYLLISKLIVPALTMDRVETDDVNDFLSIVLAAIGALAIGAIGDRVLKRVWPSGRTLTMEPNVLRLHNRTGADIVLDLSLPISATSWRFKVRRASPRAQSGWYMMASQIAQDETLITFYSFLPPKQADALPLIQHFVELLSKAELGRKNQPLRLISEQRRLETVENDRIIDGAELQPKDFLEVVDRLKPFVTSWRIDAPKNKTVSEL